MYYLLANRCYGGFLELLFSSVQLKRGAHLDPDGVARSTKGEDTFLEERGISSYQAWE